MRRGWRAGTKGANVRVCVCVFFASAQRKNACNSELSLAPEFGGRHLWHTSLSSARCRGLPAAGSERRGRLRYPFPAEGSERRGRFRLRCHCPARHLRALGRGPSRSHPSLSGLPSPRPSAPGPWTTRTPVAFEALRQDRHRRAGARADGGACACVPHSSSRWSPAFSAPSSPFVLSSSARCSGGGLRGVSRRRLRSLRGCPRRRRESQPVAPRHGGATASWAH